MDKKKVKKPLKKPIKVKKPKKSSPLKRTPQPNKSLLGKEKEKDEKIVININPYSLGGNSLRERKKIDEAYRPNYYRQYRPRYKEPYISPLNSNYLNYNRFPRLNENSLRERNEGIKQIESKIQKINQEQEAINNEKKQKEHFKGTYNPNLFNPYSLSGNPLRKNEKEEKEDSESSEDRD